MDDIAKDLQLLGRLVRTQSRLIVPEVGAFLVKNAEAGFRLENVSFSPFLRFNDHLLEHLMVNEYAIPMARAIERVHALSTYIQGELNAKREVIIEGLGSLKPTPSLHFEVMGAESVAPSTSAQNTSTPTESETTEWKPYTPTANYTVGAPSVPPTLPQEKPKQETPPPLQATPPTQQRAKEKKATQRPTPKRAPSRKNNRPKPAPQGTKRKKKKGKGAFIVFLLLLLLVGAGFAAYFYYPSVLAPLFEMKPEWAPEGWNRASSPENEATLPENTLGFVEGAMTEAADSALSLADSASDLAQEFNERIHGDKQDEATDITDAPTSSITQSASYNTSASMSAPSPAESSATVVESSSGRYYVVVGSFENYHNASAFEQSLISQGFEAEMIKRPSGMTAVSIGSYGVLHEAMEACEAQSDQFPNAWILKP